jgi:hypothetical protein
MGSAHRFYDQKAYSPAKMAKCAFYDLASASYRLDEPALEARRKLKAIGSSEVQQAEQMKKC